MLTRLLCGLLLACSGSVDAESLNLRLCHNQEISPQDGDEPAFALLDRVLQRHPQIRVEYVALPWARCLAEAALGERVDGVVASSHSTAREGLVFPRRSDGRVDEGRRMFRLGYVLIRLRGSEARWTGQRFEHLRAPLGVQLGYSIGDFAREHGAEVDPSNLSADAMLRKLVLGRISAMLVSQPHLRHLQSRPEWNQVLERNGPLLAQKAYYLAFSPRFARHHPRRVEHLWRDLRSERRSSEFQAVYRRHVGGGVRDRP